MGITPVLRAGPQYKNGSISTGWGACFKNFIAIFWRFGMVSYTYLLTYYMHTYSLIIYAYILSRLLAYSLACLLAYIICNIVP